MFCLFVFCRGSKQVAPPCKFWRTPQAHHAAMTMTGENRTAPSRVNHSMVVWGYSVVALINCLMAIGLSSAVSGVRIAARAL